MNALINWNSFFDTLHENGVEVSRNDGNIVSVRPLKQMDDFSYTVTNNELTAIHLKNDDIEITFNNSDNETILKIAHGKIVHTAIIGD